MKRLASICSAWTLAVAIMTNVASAQSLPAGNGIQLSLSVINPAPGQTVVITAASYSFNINAATLTWTSGGKVLAKGVGVTSVSVPAPALGKKLTVSVTAVTPGGLSSSASATFGSGSVDMILEPDGYTPPFFNGKLPVAYQNAVKIVAVPHIANPSGVEYDPGTLVYQWKLNDTVLQDQSGYGKQSVNIQGTLVPRPYTVTVAVSTRSGSAQAQGVTAVTASAPSVALYQDDPLYGPLFNKALGSTAYIGSQRELPILAVPYGFNGLSSNGLSLSWLINNLPHPELSGSDTITLRAPSDGSSGSSNIKLDVTSSQNILEQATVAFTAVFSQSTSTSIQQTPVSF